MPTRPMPRRRSPPARAYTKTAGSGLRNRAIALGNRGAAYKMLGRYDEAIADFGLAIELDPDNSQYYCQRAMCACAKARTTRR